jgi:arylformamidase
MTLLIDISPPICAGIATWPGDTPFSMRKISTFDDGALDLGTIETSLHVGAHTDAPLHYHPDGVAIDEVGLDAYYGSCEVVDVAARRGQRFGIDDLAKFPDASRVLLRTGTFPDPSHWNNDFAAPSPELIDALGDAGCKLVGFDTPSTDLMESKGLPAHRALMKWGMANLEGLVLSHVEPGLYTLSAFPLRIPGADASPVRAVLIRE